MADTPFFYLLDPERLIPTSDIALWLGRIVKHYAEPDASYTPSDPSPFITTPISANALVNTSSVLSGSNNTSLSAALAKSASVAASKSSSSGTDFTTPEILSVRMQKYDTIFDSMRQNDEVKADLGRMLTPGGKPAFMIVAVLIWTDASFTDVRSLESSVSGSVTAPLTATVAATTGVVVPGINPKLKGEKGSSTSRKLAGLSLGSHIFALQYKAVRRPAWAIGRSFTPKLEDKGPRVEGVKRFAGRLEEESKTEDGPVEVEMDEDLVSWTDVLDEDEGELETEELGELALAFTGS
ncbi:hypothetical protein BU16DRAFT_530324 [Lophium mytilinum]|uniref:Uncharacterized protein n=1 Tax=Lophium mytilinum TaxID=390894 RepID=A0A6A6QGS3_9PEZI|nr:hypothetical protein BU16DRAFT_530324 [Lophium mytilinum]